MPDELRSVGPAVRDLKEVECRQPIGWEDREGATTASKRYRLIVAHKAQLGCLCRPRRGTASLRRAFGHQRPDQRKFAPDADHRKPIHCRHLSAFFVLRFGPSLCRTTERPIWHSADPTAKTGKEAGGEKRV